jgi:hypothetical protein
MWKGYWPIVAKLAEVAKALIIERKLDWLIPRLDESRTAAAFTLVRGSVAMAKEFTKGSGTEGISKLIADLPDDFAIDGGCTIIPRESGVVPREIGVATRMSYCSSERILGDLHFLEDGKTTITRQEALMWFDVTPFSPLPTHKRYVPL